MQLPDQTKIIAAIKEAGNVKVIKSFWHDIHFPGEPDKMFLTEWRLDITREGAGKTNSTNKETEMLDLSPKDHILHTKLFS